MSKKALVLVTHGSEEIETVGVVDLLRRAGIETTLCGVGLGEDHTAVCSRNVTLKTDAVLEEIGTTNLYDVLVIPGGMGDGKGARELASNTLVQQLVQHHVRDERWIACICAAAIVLKASNMMKGARLTSHPSVKEELKDAYDYIEGDAVVQDKHLISSRGPGGVFDFALAIITALLGTEEMEKVKGPLMMT